MKTEKWHLKDLRIKEKVLELVHASAKLKAQYANAKDFVEIGEALDWIMNEVAEAKEYAEKREEEENAVQDKN